MMRQEDLLKKTGAILNELQEQYEFMLQDPQQISELELELFLANANFLTEHVQILRKISNYHPVKALPEHAEPSKLDGTNAAPTKVFDDFFTPDKETPTFEFIVNDRPDSPHFVAESTSQIIEPSLPEDEDPEEDPDYPEKELYEIEEPEDETYDAPVEEPVEDPKPLNRNVHPVYSNMDISSIPPEQIADDELVAQELSSREQAEEEDEVGPEPFLVTPAPEPVRIPEPASTPEPAPIPIVVAVPEPIVPIFTTPTYTEPKQEPEIETFTPKYSEPEPLRPQSPPPAAAPTHQPTLNELLAAGRLGSTKAPEPEATKPPIADLRRAISLNEKLLFVKDLFDGYNLAYAEAIDLVNKMPDFNTADQFLQKHYATKHNWASKKSTADQFYDLLRQRFPK